MNIADRALAAHEAKTKEDALRKEAELVRRRAAAVDAIALKAEHFGVDFNPDIVEKSSYSERSWALTVQVDNDAWLVFTATMGEPLVTVKVKPADQLYWDLPPGQTEKKPNEGGSYACYQLGSGLTDIQTLADLGNAIVRVRKAREQWRKKHGLPS